jgi:spore germination protein (amino acid permease)
MVMIFLSLLSPLIRILPHASVILAGHTAWLSVVPATVIAVLYQCFVWHFLKYSQPGDNLYTVSVKSLGNVGGKIFAVICVLWFLFYSGFLARSAAERLLSSVYQNGTAPLFILVTLFVAVVSSSGSTNALVRTGELFLPIIVVVFAFVILAALKDTKVEYLLPVTYMDTGKILLGAIPIIDVISLQVFFTFLTGGIKDREKLKGASVKWMLFEMLCIFGVMIVTIGFCSTDLTLKFQNPFFMVIRNISLFGIFERIEAIIIAVWILTDFMLIASLLMIIGEIMKYVTKSEKRRPFTIASGIISAFVALFMVSNAFDLQSFNDLYVPAINLTFSFVIIPIVLLIGLLRGKIGRFPKN